MPQHPHRLAVDIGGTFVDLILFDVTTGRWRLDKSFTTPEDPADGVNAAIAGLEVDATRVGSFIHGTTLGLNTVLERKGAVTGVLTNAGFEDVLEMGRYTRDRAQMYSLEYHEAKPLVPRRMRLGIPGRMNAPAKSCSRWMRRRCGMRPEGWWTTGRSTRSRCAICTPTRTQSTNGAPPR